MAELAIVRPFAGPLTVERVIDDLRRSIVIGDIPPEYPLSLTEIAATHRVRLSTLVELARSLERESLVTLRGQTAIVAPLDPRELETSFRLRRLISGELLARACRIASAQDIRAVAAHFSADQVAGLANYQETRRVYLDHLMVMVRPAASNWDRRVLLQLWQRGHRYETYGYAACDRHADPCFRSSRAAGQFMVERLLELGGLYQARRADELKSESNRLSTLGQRIAELSLTRGAGNTVAHGPWRA